MILVVIAFIFGGDAFLQQLLPRRLISMKCWKSPPKYFVEFLQKQEADRAADRLEFRRYFEILSNKISVLSEESVRGRVAKLKGVPWADPMFVRSLEDVVHFIEPLLLGIKPPGSHAYEKKDCELLLARRLQPYLKLYLDAVKSFLLKHYAHTEKELTLSKLTDYSDLPGRLIGIICKDNETWKRRLLRFKEASQLINLESPSDEQLEALISPDGPGIVLACGAAKEMLRQRQTSHFTHKVLEVPGYDLENPFTALADPFVDELKEEIEVCLPRSPP